MAKLIRALLTVGFVIVTSAAGAQNDPYAEGQRDLQSAEFQNFVKQAEFLYFAFDCDVFALWKLDEDSLIVTALVNNSPYNQSGTEFYKFLNAARDAGLNRKRSEGCSYWHEHPEAVRFVREYIHIW